MLKGRRENQKAKAKAKVYIINIIMIDYFNLFFLGNSKTKEKAPDKKVKKEKKKLDFL